MVTVGDLLDARGDGLRLHGTKTYLEREVKSVLITELADPRHLLRGGELVLTSGLRQRDRGEQASFVRWVARMHAAGIGFGVGPSHEAVPSMTLTVAEENDLPVLEVPRQTSLDSIRLRFDALRSASQRKQHAQQTRQSDRAVVQRRMLDSVLSDAGIKGVLDCRSEVTGAPAAIVELPTRVLATAPDGYDWALDHLAEEGVQITPIDLTHTRAAVLSAATGELASEWRDYAAGLVKLELAKLRAAQAGRRELAGQVIEDIVRSVVSSSEAARKLSAVGMDPTATHSVVLTKVDPAAASMSTDLGWLRMIETAAAAASIAPYEAVVLRDNQPAAEFVRLRAQRGTPGISVGIGGPYPGVHGLRWAYLEAQQAVAKGPGVHEGIAISMPRLLMSNPDLPVREVAKKTLQPVIDFDSAHGSDLMRTLDAFLDCGGALRPTAQRLYVHRNTVRNRLEQVERLIGRSISGMESRVDLWLALQAVS